MKQEVSHEQLNQPDQQDQPAQADHPNQDNERVQGGVEANEQGVQNEFDEIISYKRKEIYRLHM